MPFEKSRDLGIFRYLTEKLLCLIGNLVPYLPTLYLQLQIKIHQSSILSLIIIFRFITLYTRSNDNIKKNMPDV